jgi:1-deoxy-D-xylulose-5-phosphate synthase
MRDGTGLKTFSNEFPKRFFDVGIAEQHAVTFAGGLAISGLKPVFAVYSTFLQRGYDQVIHDICMQNLPVMFAIDRAGIVGEDGETHQGVFDISFLRSIPNLTFLAPKSIDEFRLMLKWCFEYNGPVAIRYPRGGDLDVHFDKNENIVKGKWECLYKGKKTAVLSVGKMVQFSSVAAERMKQKGMDISLINCRFIKPLDKTLLESIFNDHDILFTVEDNYVSGGFGTSVLEYAAFKGYKGKIVNLGYPDEFITHGAVNLLYKKYGLDADGIYETILKNM